MSINLLNNTDTYLIDENEKMLNKFESEFNVPQKKMSALGENENLNSGLMP